MTLGDIFVAMTFFKLSHNPHYENSNILQAVVSKYPKVEEYVALMLEDFKEWRETALKSGK